MLTAGTSISEVREREFSRLDRQGLTYLDYTGSALYGESQIRAHHALLSEGVFGNPHSDHAASRASTQIIDHARERVLRFFGVDTATHDVIFTANTTAAIKLVAESYRFSPDAPCVLSVDNHNSVNGIRMYARRARTLVQLIPLDEELRLRDAEAMLALYSGHGRGLVAFPAQSNFSGVRHPLSVVTNAKKLGYDVLLDIAAMAPSTPINLRTCPADFAALSFYKLFGYPTGVGALIARREALARLKRPWFAGGTVLYASILADTHRLRPHHDGFEDGTPNFLGIAALAAGFSLLDEVGMSQLCAHVMRLTGMFLEELGAMRHVRIYGPRNLNDRGGAVAFNVLDRTGSPIPYTVVENDAMQAGLAVRGGCFCNPGAAEVALGLDAVQTAACLETLRSDFTVGRFAACLDSAVGAVRVSFGLANNEDDVRRAISFLARYRA